VLEAPALVARFNYFAVMRQAVEQSRRHLGVAEDARNLLLTAAHATNEMWAIFRLVMITQNQQSIGPICDLYRDIQMGTRRGLSARV